MALTLACDRRDLPNDGESLAYVTINLADHLGTVAMTKDVDVRVSVDGPATLAGLGSADPAPTHPYTGTTTRTFRGRSLAIIRSRRTPTPGPISITVTSELGTQTITLESRPDSPNPDIAT